MESRWTVTSREVVELQSLEQCSVFSGWYFMGEKLLVRMNAIFI